MLSEILQSDWSMKTISASINKMGFSFVNSELISVSVLVEEILIECEETIGEYFQPFQTNSRSLLTDWLPGCLPDSDWLRSLMQLKL